MKRPTTIRTVHGENIEIAVATTVCVCVWGGGGYLLQYRHNWRVNVLQVVEHEDNVGVRGETA